MAILLNYVGRIFSLCFYKQTICLYFKMLLKTAGDKAMEMIFYCVVIMTLHSLCIETGKHLCISFTHLHSASKSLKSTQPRSQHCHLETCPPGTSICTLSFSTNAFLLSTAAWVAAGGLVWRQENGVGGPPFVFQVSLRGKKSTRLLADGGTGCVFVLDN